MPLPSQKSTPWRSRTIIVMFESGEVSQNVEMLEAMSTRPIRSTYRVCLFERDEEACRGVCGRRGRAASLRRSRAAEERLPGRMDAPLFDGRLPIRVP
jgi:hypothetical protein